MFFLPPVGITVMTGLALSWMAWMAGYYTLQNYLSPPGYLL
jgi:hypothetical protein